MAGQGARDGEHTRLAMGYHEPALCGKNYAFNMPSRRPFGHESVHQQQQLAACAWSQAADSTAFGTGAVSRNLVTDFLVQRQCPMASSLRTAAAGGGENNLSKGSKSREKIVDWSEAEVSTLLEAYRARYVVYHHLTSKDWSEITRIVNVRGLKGDKCPEQCRNKIDNLKKKFKQERIKRTPSAWRSFPALDAIDAIGRAPLAIANREDLPCETTREHEHRSDPDIIPNTLHTNVLTLPPPLQQRSPPPQPRPIAASQAMAPAHEYRDCDQNTVMETMNLGERDGDVNMVCILKYVTSEMKNFTDFAEVKESNHERPARKKRKNVCYCQAGKYVAASIANFADIYEKVALARMEMHKHLEVMWLEMQHRVATMVRDDSK